MAQTAWQIWRKKIFIFLPSKKTPYTVSFLQNWKNKYYSTKQKIFLNILGLICRIEEMNIVIILPTPPKKWLYYSTKQKKLISLQTWKKMCLKTEVKVDFNIDGTKYF